MKIRQITCTAPAKLNLALDVVGTLPGGYHDLDMLMQTVTLYETVIMIEDPEIRLELPDSDIPPDENNTAYKAARLFFETTGVRGGVRMAVLKGVPAQAGMAGGSADAAAVLVGLDRLYNTQLGMAQLLRLGARVGADVPFSLMGGTCRVGGIGDRLQALEPLPDCRFVAVMPEYGISTPACFAEYDRVGSPDHPDCAALAAAVNRGDLNGLAAGMSNALEQAAAGADTGFIRSILNENGALASLMTGSGAAVFGLFDDPKKAAAAHKALRQKYRKVYLMRPDPKGARVSEDAMLDAD